MEYFRFSYFFGHLLRSKPVQRNCTAKFKIFQKTVLVLRVKNRTYYFFNDTINIGDFDSSLKEKVGQKEKQKTKQNIKQKEIDDYENIYNFVSYY